MPAGGRGRRPKKKPSGAAPTKIAWALEATLATMGADDPSQPRRFPYLVIGMGVLQRPGANIAEAAMQALSSIRLRGYPAGWLAADNVYTNLVPESFQLPARSLGYRVVLDYKETQLGIKDGWHGAVQVEGAWYCPAMPQPNIDATLDYVEGRIDEFVWRQRVRGRTPFLLRPRARADADGTVRLLCPASGTAPTVRCELKPKSERRTNGGVPRVVPDVDLVASTPPICARESIAFPPEVGAKFAQQLQYATEDWRAVYETLRNTIEGKNGVVKDGAFEAMGTPTRHRIRGVAAQTVFSAFALFGMNLRLIDTFEANSRVGRDGDLELPRKRRRVPESISVRTASAVLGIGDEVQLTAIASYRTGSTSNITRYVEWSTSDASVATVTKTGLVTAQRSGRAVVSAASHASSGPGEGTRQGSIELIVAPTSPTVPDFVT